MNSNNKNTLLYGIVGASLAYMGYKYYQSRNIRTEKTTTTITSPNFVT